MKFPTLPAPRPAGPELRLAPADLDVVRHGLELPLGGDGAEEVLRVPRRALRELRGPRDDRVDETPVEAPVDDRARAGRALLALEPERGGDDLRDREVEVRVLVDDDEVLAAHLEDDALDPALALRDRGRLLVDPEADLLRARERDEAGLRVLDEEVADLAARAGQVVERAGRHAGLLEEREDPPRDERRVGRGLEDDAVPRDERRGGHPREDRVREVPGRDHGAGAERDVESLGELARVRRDGDLAAPAQHLSRVELEEVDRLGGLDVGLGPRLADLEDHRGREVVLAGAHPRRGAQEDRGALARGQGGPGARCARRPPRPP